MASRVQGKGGTADPGTVAITFDSTTTSGNTVIVWVYLTASSGAITCTDNKGNTYTSLGSHVSAAPSKIECFYCDNITGGSSHQVTCGSGAAEVYATLTEVSGLLSSSSGDQFAADESFENTSSPNTGTLGQADEFVMGFIGCFSTNSNFTAGAGFTEGTEVDGSGESVSDEWQIVASTSAVAATWSASTSDSFHIAVGTFKILTGAAATKQSAGNQVRPFTYRPVPFSPGSAL